MSKKEVSRVIGIATLPVAVAAAAGLIIGKHVDSGPDVLKMARVQHAAELVAQRFSGKVVELRDEQAQPSADVMLTGDPTHHTTVKVEVDLTPNPAAQAAVDRYQNDDTVFWERPAGGADLVDGTKPYGKIVDTDGLAARMGQPADPDSLTFDLYPPTDVPDGTEADIYYADDVLTNPTDDVTVTTTGVVMVGRMEFHNGAWGPSSLPTTIPSHFRYASNPVIHSTDGQK